MPDNPADSSPPVITATSPTADLDRLSHIVSTAQDKIAAQAIDFLDKSIPTTLPTADRQRIILSASQQIAHQAIKELSQYPSLDLEEYAAAQQHAIAQAVHLAQQTNNRFFNLTSHKQRQQLSQELQNSLSPEQAQQTAQATHQINQLPSSAPQSHRELAQDILKQSGENFNVSPEEAADILQEIETQVVANNNLSQPHLESATDYAANKYLGDTARATQFSQKLKDNQQLVKDFITTSTKSLPRKTPFTPFSPAITPKTLRQARSLQVNPLALAYVKSGFPSDHPQIPKYLRTQISQARARIDNPQSTPGFWGKITASSLQPQTFLAQKHYFPLYQAHQQALSKANKFVEKPYNFYQTVSDKYQDFQKSYQDLKEKKPLGWVISPRFRLRLAWSNTKLNLATKANNFIDQQKTLRKVRQKITTTTKSISRFRDNWSPTALRRRAAGWTIKKTAQALAWLGGKTGIKFFTAASLAILESSTIIGIPLAILQVSFSTAMALFRKLKQKIKQQQVAQDTADLATRFAQTIFGLLRGLGALLFGSLGGLIGSFAGGLGGTILGFFVAGPVGAIIGGITGFIGGGLVGTALGSLIGFSWMTLAGFSVAAGVALFGPNGILGGGLTGITAANLANTTTLIGLGTGTVIPALLTHHHLTTISAAFTNPQDSLHQLPTNPDAQAFQCEQADQTTPTPPTVVYSSDGQYAFPVPPTHGYGCTHWGSNPFAVDIFVATSADQPIVANPVVAYTSGTVTWVEYNHQYAGINLTIHGSDGRNYYYSHNCAIYVNVGDSVSAGQVVATTDRTGVNAEITPEHLHFEIIDKNGDSVCPQKDFEEKFHFNVCSPEEQCTPI